jgi:signal transduction histidine kinase
MTQRQILNAKEEWEETFDAIEEIITILDNDLKITRINKSGVKAFNSSFEELLNVKCYKAFGNSSEMCPDCPVSEVIADGKTHYCEKQNPIIGKTFWISVAPLLNEFGKLNGFVHVARDITHQRTMERQMINNQKMAALTVLTGGIAHNFRNILARILANSQVIETFYSDDKQLQEISTWITESVHAGSKLVNGLVQFSQPGSKTDFQVIDLTQLIPDFHEFISSSIPKNINMTHDVLASTKVEGNYSALFQVLTNICSNAVDAMDDEGELTIKVSEEEGHAKIKITDTGTGMDENISEKIFEPFFTTKDVDKGTGLGLSSSYGIITEHGGDIEVKSQKGSGSTFTIILPLLEGSADDSQITTIKDIDNLG